MFRRKSLIVLGLAVLAVGFARPAHASIYLSSSMSAGCSNAACDQITFALKVPDQGRYSNAMVDFIELRVLKAFFEIAEIQEIWHYLDGVKQTLSWDVTYHDDPVDPKAEIEMSTGFAAAQPIYLRVAFNRADSAHLTDGSVRYSAHGYGVYEYTGELHEFVAQGHVTPEPITMILMGTGLVGIGGAARRRRKVAQAV